MEQFEVTEAGGETLGPDGTGTVAAAPVAGAVDVVVDGAGGVVGRDACESAEGAASPQPATVTTNKVRKSAGLRAFGLRIGGTAAEAIVIPFWDGIGAEERGY